MFSCGGICIVWRSRLQQAAVMVSSSHPDIVRENSTGKKIMLHNHKLTLGQGWKESVQATISHRRMCNSNSTGRGSAGNKGTRASTWAQLPSASAQAYRLPDRKFGQLFCRANLLNGWKQRYVHDERGAVS